MLSFTKIIKIPLVLSYFKLIEFNWGLNINL